MLVPGTVTRSKSPCSYEARAASGSPPMAMSTSVRVGFRPYQFGFGFRTMLELWSHVATANGPDEPRSATSLNLVHDAGRGTATHIAMILLKYVAGRVSFTTTVVGSGAGRPIF